MVCPSDVAPMRQGGAAFRCYGASARASRVLREITCPWLLLHATRLATHTREREPGGAQSWRGLRPSALPAHDSQGCTWLGLCPSGGSRAFLIGGRRVSFAKPRSVDIRTDFGLARTLYVLRLPGEACWLRVVPARRLLAADPTALRQGAKIMPSTPRGSSAHLCFSTDFL